MGRKPTSDAERAALAWKGWPLEERGQALWNLLLLSDALPMPERSATLKYPVIKTIQSDAKPGAGPRLNG